MAKDADEKKHPEEIEMMTKASRMYYDKAQSEEECAIGPWRPPFLQRFSGPWTFTIVVGLASLVSEFMHVYLKTQLPMLRRLYEVDTNTTDKMVYSSEIACLISVIFFCVLAKRIHIPRFLAISTLICGLAGILCIVPFLATRNDLVPAQRVLENETYSLEKYVTLIVPPCRGGPISLGSDAWGSFDAVKRPTNVLPLSAEKLTPVAPKTGKQEGLQSELSSTAVLPDVTTTSSKLLPLPDRETIRTTTTPPTTTTVAKPKVEHIETIPDFKKLSTHPLYPQLVSMSKTMKIDLEKLVTMSLGEQIDYLKTLPPNLKAMLPNLKLLLGDNADSYFIKVDVDRKVIIPSRRKRNTGESNASSSSEEKTVLMPDFKKLTKHPQYPMLVDMSKKFNVDLKALAGMNLDDQIEYVRKLPPQVRGMLPQLKLFLGEDADSYFIRVKLPTNERKKKVTIPDFKKLKTHPKFPTLVTMAKNMNVDLDKLAEMDLDKQLEYLDELPPNIKDMLPQLKSFLGDNADSYFMEVMVKVEANETSDSSSDATCVEVTREIFEEIYHDICPFNTGPFLINSSTEILGILNFAMVIQGIVRGPRLAFAISFLDDNTKGKSTVLHLGILCGITFFGPVLSLVLGFYTNSIYITDEDIGHMTFFNPRWLPAWWLGFVYLAIASFIFTLPLIFFPKKLRSRPVKEYRNMIPRLNVAVYFADLFKTLFQLFINPVYMSLLLGHLLSAFVWTGIASVLITYVTHQFSLEPVFPGVSLLLAFSFIGSTGIFIGGIIATKFDHKNLAQLKLALGLACGLIIIQAFQLGLGCDQPYVDTGEKVLTNYTTSTCKCACGCIDHIFQPGCGSDGVTYQSPCHAGCTESIDEQFHKCQCIEDDVQTFKPGHCSGCDMFIPFALVLCIGGLIAGIQFIPLLMATIRSVRPEQVPLAVGLRTMLFIAVVALPSPIAFKAIQNSHCLRDYPECGIMDPCILYDIVPFRFHLFGVSLGIEFLGALLLLVAFLMRRR